MARCRFVQPDSKRLDLTGGDWIEVKVELTAGETRDLFGRMRPYVTPGELNQLIAKEVGIARIVAYLLDWSFVDPDLKRVPVSVQAIDGLFPEDFAEVLSVIDVHIAAQDSKRAAEKNGLAGSTNSAAT